MGGGREKRPGSAGRAEEAAPRRDLWAGKRPLTATLPAATPPAVQPAENADSKPRPGWFLGHFVPQSGEGEASAGPDPGVHDHAGRLRQLSDPKDPSNPNNTLEPQEMYDVWRALWTSREDLALPRREALEAQIRARNPAAYADNMNMFRAGRRDALGPEYQAAADEADLCTAQLSVMNDVLGWLEGRKAMRQRVTLDQVNRHALETARAKSIYVNLFMTALLVGGHPAFLSRGLASGAGGHVPGQRAPGRPAEAARTAESSGTARSATGPNTFTAKGEAAVIDEVVGGSGGSIKQAIASANQAGLAQSQAVQALSRVVEASGRHVGAVVDVAGGAKVLTGVIQGVGQPIVHISASGTATFGTASVTFGVDSAGKLVATVTNIVLP